MAIEFVTFASVPLAVDYPIRFPLNRNDYNFSARVFYENGLIPGNIVKRRCAIYFHGSGSVGYPDADDAVIEAMTSRGFNVIAFRNFNSGNSSDRPQTVASAYLNVASPSFQHSAYVHAWQVQSALEFWAEQLDVYFTNDQVLLYGHSLGATSILGWSTVADTPGFFNKEVVRSMFGNSATNAGLGNFRWNHPQRVISGFDFLYSNLKHPMVATYADADSYAPPDMAKRYYYSQRENPLVTFYSPGNFGHSWIDDSPELVDYWGDLAVNLYEATPPQDTALPVTRFNFTNTEIPMGTSFSRASSAQRVNQDGYLETVGPNIPRLEVSPVTLEPNGIFIERPATNLIPNNTDFQGNLTLNGGATVVNTVRSGVFNPAGSTILNKLVEGPSSAGTTIHGGSYLISPTIANELYSETWYVRGAERNYGYIELSDEPGTSFARAFYDIPRGLIYATTLGGTATEVSASMENAGGGWYRVRLSARIDATSLRVRFRILKIRTTALNYIGDGTSGLYIFRPQLEVGEATSAIPTTGIAATRTSETLALPSKPRTEGTFLFVHTVPAGKPLLGGTGVNNFVSQGPGRTAFAFSGTEVRVSQNGGVVTVLPGQTLDDILYVGGGRLNDRMNSRIARIDEYATILPDSTLRRISD